LPTVSDANVVLGRIAPTAALGGSVTVHRELAVDAIGSLASRLGLSVEDAALGVVAIAEAVMAQAVRKVSIEQGSDPRGAFLYAFGGAGGLHASALARSLGMAGVVIPPHGGVFSALGLLLAPPRSDAAVNVLGRATGHEVVADAAEKAGKQATARLVHAGHTVVTVEYVIDVRYLGQSHEIGIPFTPSESIDAVTRRFHDAHSRRNGFTRPDDPIEVVTVRAAAFGTPAVTIAMIEPKEPQSATPSQSREVTFDSGPVDTAVVRRDELSVGDIVRGPAIFEESEATTVIGPSETATVLATGAIEVSW
jgi:N-methylhydantoinase A